MGPTDTATDPSSVEARYEGAQARYFAAAGELIQALTDKIVTMVLDAFPRAATLQVLGEFGDEFNFIVRAQEVLDGAGNVIAGIGPRPGVAADLLEDFEALTDEIDPLLDWLGDLTGDDYLGSKTIDLEITGAITTPGDVSSPERQALVRLHRYVIEGDHSAADQCQLLYEVLDRFGLRVP